jgi:hypothetical protein
MTSDEEHITVTSEYFFEVANPFSEEIVRLTRTSDAHLRAISFTSFMEERLLLFELPTPPDLTNRLTMHLAAFSQCIVAAIGGLGGPREIDRFLIGLILANPFGRGETHLSLMRFVIQAVCDWRRSNFEVLSAIFDFCCNRIIDESFLENPFGLLSAILCKYQQLGKSVSPTFMLAFEASVARHSTFQLMHLFIHHEQELSPRIDFDCAILILTSLTQFWNDSNPREKCTAIFTIVRGQIQSCPEHARALHAWLTAVTPVHFFTSPQRIHEDGRRSLQAIGARNQDAKARIAEDTRGEVQALAQEIARHGAEFCTAVQSSLERWALEVRNHRLMFTSALAFDLSVYTRVREKASPFARFTAFAEACEASDVLRERLFKLVYDVRPGAIQAAVVVRVDAYAGKCLLIQHAKEFLLVDDLNEKFVVKPNAQAFDVTLATSVAKCYRFEGRIVVPLECRGLTVLHSEGVPVIIAPSAGAFVLAIRAAEPDDHAFLAAVAVLEGGARRGAGD